MRAPIATLLTLALIAVGTTGGADVPPSDTAFQVIVNPRNATTTIDRKFLADAFLKKLTRWNDLEMIRPVDLRSDDRVRQAFSHGVLKRSPAAVKYYWQQQVFSGRDVPPPELQSDDDVVEYVLRYPGAVGYVSPKATLNGTRVLTVK